MPDNQLFDWQRFWSSRNAHINLSDNGFLVDPMSSTFAKSYNPELVTSQDFILEPCLVLLGEPGSGKSTELCRLYRSTQERISNSRDIILYYNLNNYSSDSLLVKDIFENPELQSWSNDSNQLYLFLDSLDEGLLTIKQLANTIGENLTKCPNERLFFRIACRTFEWPSTLESILKNLWSGQVKVYEIAPLRRTDVVEAASREGINFTRFLEEIVQNEIVPLSIKPITLKLLFNTFKKHGSFPLTRSQLYENGCRLLCEEINDSRRVASQTGTLSAIQRLIVAGRIAAVLLIANKSAIFTGIDWGNLPITDLSIDSLIGSAEQIVDINFPINRAEILETLSTGLFTSRGEERFGFAHQTYAEFAAGWYLARRELTIYQTQSLIFHPGDGGKKLIPQLREMAAWIASFRNDVYDLIMSCEPSVLLLSDITNADEGQRSALVSKLLKLYEKEKLFDSDWTSYYRYRKLFHPKLDDQLKNYFEDRTKGTLVRRIAIDMAQACKLTALGSDLLQLALDPTEQMVIRKNAACAISRIGDVDAKKHLLPLARGEVGEDPDDELKGWGLTAIWPNLISTKELFKLLTPIKNPDLYGSYYIFLSNLRNNISNLNLEDALIWVQTQPGSDHMRHNDSDLIDAIMIAAWEQVDSPRILDLFAKAIYSRLIRYEGIISRESTYVGGPTSLFRQSFESADNKRHSLIMSLLNFFLKHDKPDFGLLIYSQPQIVLQKDFVWVLQQLHATNNIAMKQALCEIAWMVFDKNDPDQIEIAFKLGLGEELLAKEFLTFFGPIELGSSLAESMKKTYEKMKKREDRRSNIPLLSPPPQERIATLLDDFEGGNVDVWWRLNLEITLNSDSTHDGNDFYRDITDMPGWKEAGTEIQTRFIKAAYEYLEKGEPNTSIWLGKDPNHRPALAGYRALYLLLKMSPDSLLNLSPSTWKKWAPIVLAFPYSGINEQQELIDELLKLAYGHAASEMIETLNVIIDKENNVHKSVFILTAVETIIDEKMNKAIFEIVKDKSLHPDSLHMLLSQLINAHFIEAIDYAKSLIVLPLPNESETRIRSIIAAQSLVQYSTDAGWDKVWSVIKEDPEFGKDMINRFATLPMRGNLSLGGKLSENSLADFCLWLFQQYPADEDPNVQGGHLISQREEIGHWRNELVNDLTNRGTYDAYQAVQYLSHHLPNNQWLKWQIYNAEMNYLRNSWQPFEPSDVLKIFSNPELRLIQSGEQLIGVIHESLTRLQQMLQGETPESVFLWNELQDKKYRPKGENQLSDYVKNHLLKDIKSRGIIANREVEIRPTVGSMQGERTDIKVDAFRRKPGGQQYDLLSMIIETKCVWNDELDTAMETQLVKRYMKDNLCHDGIYLVGWYDCPQWDENDKRRSKSQKHKQSDLKRELKDQAQKLSINGVNIREYVLDVSLRHLE